MGRKRKPPLPVSELAGDKKARHSDTELLLAGLQAFILKKHPDFLRQPTFVPPVHMNQQHLTDHTIANVGVHQVQGPVMDLSQGGQGLRDSTVRDDIAQKLVLHCFRILSDSKPEVMTVISKLRYEDYLNDPCYKSLADDLPTPRKMPKEYRRGDFDILVISPQHGILIVETKAVSDRFDERWSVEKKDALVLGKLKLVIKQLNKSKTVVQYLVSDVQPSLPVRTAVAFPNIKREELRRILMREQSVNNDLCQCVAIQTGEDPTSYCLCEDDLPTRDTLSHISQENLDTTRLTEWRRRVFTGSSSARAMSDGDYTLLVARFCGPATFAPPFKLVKPQNHLPETDRKRHYTHSLGDAVSDVGDKFTRRVLTGSQIDVLENGRPLTFIDGPPGTGKTVVLMLRACKWLVLQHEVHVVSTWTGSLAASNLIASELMQVSPNSEHRVHLHHFDLKDGDSTVQFAVSTLLEQAHHGQLFVVCDEAFASSEFTHFCTQLKAQCKLHLWAASVYHGYCPPCLEEVSFDQALRTPPVITKQVMQSVFIKEGNVRPYKDFPAPQPSDGPPPIKIDHNQTGHSHKWPGECEKCGVELGTRLKQLCTGSSATSELPAEDGSLEMASGSPDITKGRCDVTTQLQFHDVVIVTTCYELEDEVRDDDGAVEQEACGMLKGLRQAGVPVGVVARGDSAAIVRVAEMKGEDMVVAADADSIRGLERKVVAWIPYETNGNTSGEEDFGRLDAISRTTSLLITVG